MKIWIAVVECRPRGRGFPREIKLCEWTREGVERELERYARRHWSDLKGEPVPAEPPDYRKDVIETYFDHSPLDDLVWGPEDVELPCFAAEFHLDEWVDYTDRIGPRRELATLPPTGTIRWPMFSFLTPAWTFWDAVANGMRAVGWGPSEIKRWLQHTTARHALESDWGDHLRSLGFKLGSEHATKIKEES